MNSIRFIKDEEYPEVERAYVERVGYGPLGAKGTIPARGQSKPMYLEPLDIVRINGSLYKTNYDADGEE